MKEEVFDIRDLNAVFYKAASMHDEIMTRIDTEDGEIVVEYGRIGENEYYKPFRKLTVRYSLSDMENDILLDVFRCRKDGKHYMEESKKPQGLSWLNGWNMVMYAFDYNTFGEMCLHFSMSSGKKYYNAELVFTPTSIRYIWEE